MMKRTFLTGLIVLLLLCISIFSLNACDGNEHSHTLDESGKCTVCGEQVLPNDGTGENDDNQTPGENEPEHLHTLDEFGWCTDCGEPTIPTEGVSYELSDDGTYAIVTGYSGTSAKVNIASEHSGVPVTSIASYAFSASSITTVVIPDSVTSIGEGAFQFCSSLTSVTLSNSLTELSNRLFYNCEGLASITIPSSVTSIGDASFSMSGVRVVTIPEGVINIYGQAFYCCHELRSIIMSDSVKFIDREAFVDCPLFIRVYYMGTEEDRTEMEIYSSDIAHWNVSWIYYSENAPATEHNGKFWHYDENGNAVFWK